MSSHSRLGDDGYLLGLRLDFITFLINKVMKNMEMTEDTKKILLTGMPQIKDGNRKLQEMIKQEKTE